MLVSRLATTKRLSSALKRGINCGDQSHFPTLVFGSLASCLSRVSVTFRNRAGSSRTVHPWLDQPRRSPLPSLPSHPESIVHLISGYSADLLGPADYLTYLSTRSAPQNDRSPHVGASCTTMSLFAYFGTPESRSFQFLWTAGTQPLFR